MSMTATERTRKHRERLKADGWKILHCSIPPKAASNLQYIEMCDGGTQAEIVTAALDLLAQQIQDRTKR